MSTICKEVRKLVDRRARGEETVKLIGMSNMGHSDISDRRRDYGGTASEAIERNIIKINEERQWVITVRWDRNKWERGEGDKVGSQKVTVMTTRGEVGEDKRVETQVKDNDGEGGEHSAMVRTEREVEVERWVKRGGNSKGQLEDVTDDETASGRGGRENGKERKRREVRGNVDMQRRITRSMSVGTAALTAMREGEEMGHVARVTEWKGRKGGKSRADREGEGTERCVANNSRVDRREMGNNGEHTKGGDAEATEEGGSVRSNAAVARTIRKRRGNNWSTREGKGGSAPPGSERVSDLMDATRWTIQKMEGGEVAYWYRDNKGEKRLWFVKAKSRMGYTLIAKRMFKVHEPMMVYMERLMGEVGSVELDEEYGRMMREWRSDKRVTTMDYIMKVGRWWMDGKESWSPARLVNDARGTGKIINAYMCEGGRRGGEGTKGTDAEWGATIKAHRMVMPGDEILMDYGDDYWAGEAQQGKLQNIEGGGVGRKERSIAEQYWEKERGADKRYMVDLMSDEEAEKSDTRGEVKAGAGRRG